MNYENIYDDIYLQEVARSAEREGFKARILGQRKIEFKSKKIKDFEFLLNKLKTAVNIGKTLKDVGYAYLFPFNQASVESKILAQQASNYIPSIISPLPMSNVYQEVFVKKGLENRYGYVRIAESKTEYYHVLNESVIFIEDIEKVDEIKSYEHFSKNMSNEYQKIFNELFYQDKSLSADVACSSLSADAGLSYSLASNFKDLLKPNIHDAYLSIQKLLPIHFRKEPFYLQLNPNHNILIKGKKLKACFYPQNVYNFNNDLTIQSYHIAKTNQTLAGLTSQQTTMNKLLDVFSKANLITDLDKSVDNERDSIFNNSIPIIDEELSIWLIHRRNFSLLTNSDSFIDKFSNFLKRDYTELPDELIRFSVSHSPLKDGFERSFQGFHRLGVLKNTEEYSKDYRIRFEGFMEKARDSNFMKYIEKMTKNKSGDESKIENAIKSILLISPRLPYRETVQTLENSLSVNKEKIDKVIKGLDKRWLSITLSGDIVRIFKPSDISY